MANWLILLWKKLISMRYSHWKRLSLEEGVGLLSLLLPPHDDKVELIGRLPTRLPWSLRCNSCTGTWPCAATLWILVTLCSSGQQPDRRNFEKWLTFCFAGSGHLSWGPSSAVLSVPVPMNILQPKQNFLSTRRYCSGSRLSISKCFKA